MFERISGLTVNPTNPASPSYIVEHEHNEVFPRLGRPPSTNYFRYTVIGRGKFPFDMLRLDGAFPADTSSALELGHDDLREIVLNVNTPNAMFLPCFDRWRSFGWVVKSDAS